MKRLTILLYISISFLLFGCTPSPPQSSSDELISHTWIIADDAGNKNGSLSFSEEHIIFNAQIGNDKDFNLNEECIITENKITVTSDNYGILIIEYKISGNTLILSYSDKQISLTKEKNR